MIMLEYSGNVSINKNYEILGSSKEEICSTEETLLSSSDPRIPDQD
jgi:hypothetical protein